MQEITKRLSFIERVSLGAVYAASNLYFLTILNFLLIYYATVVGLPIFVIGTLYMVMPITVLWLSYKSALKERVNTSLVLINFQKKDFTVNQISSNK